MSKRLEPYSPARLRGEFYQPLSELTLELGQEIARIERFIADGTFPPDGVLVNPKEALKAVGVLRAFMRVEITNKVDDIQRGGKRFLRGSKARKITKDIPSK